MSAISMSLKPRPYRSIANPKPLDSPAVHSSITAVSPLMWVAKNPSGVQPRPCRPQPV